MESKRIPKVGEIWDYYTKSPMCRSATILAVTPEYVMYIVSGTTHPSAIRLDNFLNYYTPPPPPKRVVWLNVYPASRYPNSSGCSVYADKKDADKMAMDNRIGCVRVEINPEEFSKE